MPATRTLVLAAVLSLSAAADDPKTDPAAVIDRAAKALGVADKPPAAVMAKAKVTIHFGEKTFESETVTTAEGVDRGRSESDGEFGETVTVVTGDKGWRVVNIDILDLDGTALANEKRTLYLAAVAVDPAVLKGKGFKVAVAADEPVDGKPAVVLTGTGPDGKGFKVLFDKATGLPVRVSAPGVAGFDGDEAEQEWTFAEYKDFGGVKRPAVTTVTRGGKKFMTQRLTEFQVLDRVDPKVYVKP
ncbi:MAG: hypothetical protein K2X82_31740 [Gemmataceae bacterium]|nr:hypothetical protein [Gemmataceae bacterium]